MPVNNDPDDYWGKVITLFTGYPMPSRKALFEKLSSKDGIPLFRMDIQSQSVSAITPENFSALTGWNTHKGEDYDLSFYTAGGNGASGSVEMWRARIVFIGLNINADGSGHILDRGQLTPGGAWKGTYGDEWDSGPLSQYLGGPKIALDALFNGTTRNVSYAGIEVADAEAVDIASFDRTAMAFDRATAFFGEHEKVLNNWKKSLGDEKAAWKGNAAGIFWHLINQLQKNYDGYSEQLGGTKYSAKNLLQSGYVPRSKYADAIAGAQQNLLTGAQNLRQAWNTWSQTYFYSPHRVVLDMLDELSAWVLENNATHVWSSEDSYATDSGFQEVSPFGPLHDIGTFRNLAKAAVKKWNEQVDAMLGVIAQNVISTLGNNWIDVQAAVDKELETKDKETLSEFYKKEVLKKDSGSGAGGGGGGSHLNDQLNKDLNKLKDGLNKDLNNLNGGLNKSLNNLNGGLNNLNGGLNNSLNNLNGGLNNLNGGLNNSLNNLTQGLSGSLNNGLSGLNDGLSGLNDGLGENLNDLGNGISDGLSNLNNLNGGLGGANGLNGLNNGLGGVPGNLAGTNPLLGSGALGGLVNPGGGSTRLNADGTISTTFPDGSTQVFDPTTGTLRTTGPNGQTTTRQLNPGDTFTNPDGSKTTLNPDGTLTTSYPDGTTTVVNPETGATTTTHPDGSVSTSNLNDLKNPLNDLSDPLNNLSDSLNSQRGALNNLNNSLNGQHNSLGDLSRELNNQHQSLHDLNNTLNSQHPLNYGAGGNGASSGQNGSSHQDYEDYDSTPYNGGSLGGPESNPATIPADKNTSGSTPLNPMMGSPMGMGGMGGMGGGGGGSNNNERVRNVLGESDGASLRKSRRSSPSEETEEMVLTRGGRLTTTSSGSVYPAGNASSQGGISTSTGYRERNAGVADEEDVWGADGEDGAPAVIG
ncbi:AAWKG family protein [Streptomyces sp. NPDC059215]|uniref:AAWKG family protein n=1 Tax=Streptomyces sp. NPDC059215 TaxID=3346772 RepID=UPI00367A4F1B